MTLRKYFQFLIILALVFITADGLFSQTQSRTITLEEQLPETDSLILKAVDEWQDKKFGFFMHWGIYAQEQLVESWSICNEEWIDRKNRPYEEYKQWYQNLNKTFNPTQFAPKKWADAAQKAGMKYVIFTTKHHDGFCMYDTKQTDYKITDKNTSPFALNDGRDITAEILKAFRQKGFMTGLYFSKADWHNENYWSPLWATPDRNVNYNIDKHPEMWRKFCDFTHNQIKELTHNYGKIDILWLDGGWIRPAWSVKPGSEEETWLGAYKRIQDIDMPKVAKIARETNPSMIIVDRSVGGKYENYRTPEQQIPDTLLDYPWETCMTMGDSWSYVKNDNYKSTCTLIHMLVDIVCKGGNFLLNVAPDQDGNLPEAALQRMDSIGEWMNINAQAIYNTRPVFPYKSNDICFTQAKDSTVYAIILTGNDNGLNATYTLPEDLKLKEGKKQILGSKQKAVLTKNNTGTYALKFNNIFLKNNRLQHAVAVVLD
ncbi:MAG: alpha-L-fucosidase [Bacteroidales bacterium]|nr:alpha-L-fucosidase [Bacteroidales bacterium]